MWNMPGCDLNKVEPKTSSRLCQDYIAGVGVGESYSPLKAGSIGRAAYPTSILGLAHLLPIVSLFLFSYVAVMLLSA
jgi:hypothetical protein